jgi:hypothetical protein
MTEYTDYRVIVSNVGTVYTGKDYAAAYAQFIEYRSMSQSLVGRAGGESVTLIGGDDIVLEYHGKLSDMGINGHE